MTTLRMDSMGLNAAYNVQHHWLADDMEQLIEGDEVSDSNDDTESAEDGNNFSAKRDLAIITINGAGPFGFRTPSVDSSTASTSGKPQIDPQTLRNSLEDMKCMLINRYMNIQLPRVPWMGDLVLPMEEYYFDLTVYQTDVSNKNQPTRIKDIFQPVHANRPSYRILIEGGPGSGKSTVAFKLAYDWARCESYIGMFELVFVVDLRDLDMGLDTILQESGHVYGVDDNVVLSAIETYVDKVLLILDGYDELPQEARKYIIPLLCSKMYPRMTVVITSKPSTVNREFFPNKILTIQGFTEKQQKSFLQKYLSPEHNYCLLQENLRGIVTKHTKELFNCPIFLLLLASFASESDSTLIWTKTTLYKQLFNFLVRRGQHKSRCSNLNEFYDLFSKPEKDASGNIGMLLKFGKLALNTLHSDVLFFTKEDILQCCGDENILNYGFLKKYLILKKLRMKELFEPLHKSLAEFLAGLYLSYLAETDWLQFEKEIKILKSSLDKYSMIIDFTAGLLELRGYKVFAALTSNSFLDIGAMHSFISTLSECDVTDDLLKALRPMMPQIWNIPRRSTERYDCVFRGTNMHCAAVRYGITVSHIRAVVCEATEFSSCYLPKDIEIPFILLNFNKSYGSGSDLSDVASCGASKFHIRELKCHELLCSIKCTPSESSGELLDLCNLVSSVKATKVSFALNDDVSGNILPILQECFGGYKLSGLYNAAMILTKGNSCNLCNVKVIIDFMLSKKIEELSLCLVRINEIPKKALEVQAVDVAEPNDDESWGRIWRIFRQVKPRLKQLHNLEEEEDEQEPAFVNFGRALFCSQCYIRKLVLVSQGLEPEETHVLSLCVRRSLRIQELYVCTSGDVPAYFDLNILCFEGSKTWKCLAFSNVRLTVGQRPKELFSIKELQLLEGKDLGTCAEALTSCTIERLVCDLDLLIEMFKLGVQNVNEYLTVRYFHLLTETRQWQTFARLEELSLNVSTLKPGSAMYEKVLCAIMSANLRTFEIRNWMENIHLVSQTFDSLRRMHDSRCQLPDARRRSDPHVPNIQLELLSLFSTKCFQIECIPTKLIVAMKIKPLLLSGNIKRFKMAMYSGEFQHSAPLHLAEALKYPFPEEEGFRISIDHETLFDWEKKNVCPLSKNFYAAITIFHKQHKT